MQDFLNEKSKAELDVRRAQERLKVAPTNRNLRDHQAAISRLFNIARRGERLRKQSNQAAGAAAKPSGGDRRYFSPGQVNPRTIYGTEAHVLQKVFGNPFSKPEFLSPHLTIPCIQREVRREVMFAMRKAGKGHRRPKRRGPFSDIGC